MKKTIFSIVFLLMFASGSVWAEPQGFLGFEKDQTSTSFFAGQPVFLRYNKFISWKRAWSVDAGYHFDKYPYFAANYAVYFYNIKDHLKARKDFFNSLLFYAGPGVFVGPDFEEVKSDEKVKLGIRIFGGVEYIFKGSPWSITAELGPALFIEGDDFIGFQGALGLTYYIGGIKKKKIRSRTRIIRDTSPSDEEDAKEFREFD
jgi:hypothetical protein